MIAVEYLREYLSHHRALFRDASAFAVALSLEYAVFLPEKLTASRVQDGHKPRHELSPPCEIFLSNRVSTRALFR